MGGAAPADCLAGKGCVGDARMAALAVENERLGKDAAGVRNILEAEEKARRKSYTVEERGQARCANWRRRYISIGAEHRSAQAGGAGTDRRGQRGGRAGQARPGAR